MSLQGDRAFPGLIDAVQPGEAPIEAAVRVAQFDAPLQAGDGEVALPVSGERAVGTEQQRVREGDTAPSEQLVAAQDGNLSRPRREVAALWRRVVLQP